MQRLPARFAARAARALLLAALVSAPVALAGCWLAAASERANGHKVGAQYTGLTDQSVAVVIYADQASTDDEDIEGLVHVPMIADGCSSRTSGGGHQKDRSRCRG